MTEELRFALIGHPVSGALEKLVHDANFKALGMAASFETMETPLVKLEETLAKLKSGGYTGFTVACPHKRNIVPLMDALDASAEKFGAVDTVKIGGDGKLTGYFLETASFIAELDAQNVDYRHRHTVIVGAGTTGRALAMGLMEAGAFDVALANRTQREGILQIDSPLCRELIKRVEILINATPLGLRKHDPCFAAKGLFDCKHTVFDTAPANLLNGSCREAFVARAKYIGGAGALVRRCAAAFEIWTGGKADVSAMTDAVSKKGDDES